MDTKLNFKTRSIAITDIETTGLNPKIHEIIEIGLVLINQPNLEIIDTYEVKIKPEYLDKADPQALQVNGYNSKDWENAVSLKEALQVYSLKTKDAMFCSHPVTFDLLFIIEGFAKTGITNPMSHHTLDIGSLAWLTLRNTDLESVSLNKIAGFLGIPREPDTHRAINGAMTAYKILKEIASQKSPRP